MLPPAALAALGTRLCAVRGPSTWAWCLRAVAEHPTGKVALVAWCRRTVRPTLMRPAGLRSRLPSSEVPEPQRPGLGSWLTEAVRSFLFRCRLAAGKGPPPRTAGLGLLGEWVLGGCSARWHEWWPVGRHDQVPMWAVRESG